MSLLGIWRLGLLLAALNCLLAACAGNPNSGMANDPFESINRPIFSFDQKLDKVILRPAAKGYASAVPAPVRSSIHNFLINLDLPVTFANDVLQGEAKRATDDFARFFMNSTFGIAGLFDPATKAGVPYHEEDFGQTLGRWGVGEGPYLVLPLLGPDPPRDAIGQGVDIFFDPTTYVRFRSHIYYSAGRSALEVVDLRSRNLDALDNIERSSVDYYATVRSLYRQQRDNEIRNGAPDVNALPDL